MATINRIIGWLRNSVVVVEQIRTTNQTFIVSRQDEDVNLPADTLVNIPFNSTDTDERGEFNSPFFTPDTDGWYEFLVHAEFGVGSDQDELKLNIYDDDNDETIFETELRSSGSGNRDRSLNALVELEEGNSYSVRAENSDSNDTINGKPKRTKLVISAELSGLELP
jgi:hypothetical protein